MLQFVPIMLFSNAQSFYPLCCNHVPIIPPIMPQICVNFQLSLIVLQQNASLKVVTMLAPLVCLVYRDTVNSDSDSENCISTLELSAIFYAMWLIT